MERLASELAENLEAFRALFHAPENCDFVVRELAPHGVRMAALYIDGMANRRNLEDMVLRPLMNMRPFGGMAPEGRSAALAAQVLRIGLLAEPLYGVSIVAAGALRGAGDTLVPSLMNLASIWGVRLGLALVLTPCFGLRGMWTAMAVELCVRGLLMLLRQRTTKYYEHSVVQTGEAAPICEEA